MPRSDVPRPPRASGGAQGYIELQSVFVGNCGVPRKALVTINRCQREPRPQTKSDAALNEVLEQVGRSLVEPLVEFNIQRFIRRKAGGDSLIEPESNLLLIFRIIGLLLLLRPGRNSQAATAQHRNDADYRPHRHPPNCETVSRDSGKSNSVVGTEPGLPMRFLRHARTSK